MKQVFYLLIISLMCGNAGAQRVTADFNKGWKFALSTDSLGPSATGFNDAGWRILNLPHDWSIEMNFAENAAATNQGGALPGGIGWYRKTFTVPSSSNNKNIYVEFDGVYRNSEVWINGHFLGKRPYGYSSFAYEMTPWLKFGATNVIAVKVDNSKQPNSRWYSGSGIYRNVRLVSVNNLHVAQYGCFVSTPRVSASEAVINIKTNISNAAAGSQAGHIQAFIYNNKGQLVITGKPMAFTAGSAEAVVEDMITLKQPALWSVEKPVLYKAVIKILQQGKVVDTYETSFGIRYFNFDREKGFSLNGKAMKILGVCNHHDLGALGAAVNVRAMERQLQILKGMGCNGIRTAHNPPAPELLDLCDKMGFIVMDEAFDMWAKKKNKFDYTLDFNEWHERDLTAMIIRDRNHPSVFLWSIGNEIREQFDTSGIRITKELVRIVKQQDTSRPVTSALTELDTSKNFIYQAHALDLLGWNYNQDSLPNFLKKYPGQKFLAAETMSALASRGDYDMPSDSNRQWPAKGDKFVVNGNKDWSVSAYDHVYAYWGSTHEATWKIIKKHDFLPGMFVWSGFDFLGEPVPYPWPARSSYYGIIDLAGFPKDVYYMYQSEWTLKPVLHIFPHWNWAPGKVVDVWAYYNQADEVELFLNGRSLGTRKKNGDELHVMWRVNYEAGTLRAVSRKNGRVVLQKTIHTAAAAAKIELVADRSIVQADGKDLSFITVRVLDKAGNLVPEAANRISFSISGPGILAGTDNGYPADLDNMKSPERNAYNGMCLAIVQAGEKAGKIVLKATAPGLEAASVVVVSK